MSEVMNKPLRGSGVLPDHIMLSFSDDPHTTATVTWRNSVDVTEGYMEYEEIGGSEKKRVEAISKTAKSDIDVSTFFYATARDLTPGKKYRYTVGSKEHRSDVFTFETESEHTDKFKFMIITDHQNSSPYMQPEYAPVRRLLKKMLKEHPDCKFIYTVGDNCDNGQNEVQWNGMFYGLQGIIESIPYMMSTGNHDNRGFQDYEAGAGKFYLDHADYFDEQFEYSYPQNGPEGFKTENYSFDYGNVHFIMLGINEPDLVNEWAYEDLRKSDKTWKLGAYHFPIYPVMPEGQNYDGYPMMRQAVEDGKLDILFAGHEHSLARTFPIKNDEMFDRPSQGTVHYIAGNSGANIYCSNAQKVWHSFFYPQEEPLAMCSIAEVDGSRITITAYLEDGRIADVFVLDKEQDMIYPYHCAPIYRNTKMAFKGDIAEMAARGCEPENIDGLWYAPLGTLFSFMGCAVEKTAGKVRITAYGKTALFTLDSNIMETDDGNIELPAKVFKGREGQLYIPLDKSVAYWGMDWYYGKRNNMIYFESPMENRTTSPQP